VKRGYRVTGIRCSPCAPGTVPAELVPVQNMEEYSSGCRVHRGGCFGHMCETPTGNILPPHSLSFRSGDIRTQYYIASRHAFEDDGPRYREELRKTNNGKEGHLRSIMSTPVSGSARLVVIPHCLDDPYVVCISPTLASKVLFCLPERGPDGREGSVYSERCLEEGDYAMVERPPSLTKLNNQPFRVLFWNKECMGVHPAIIDAFSGDYDGDELHLYALGTEAAISEAREWKPPLNPKFLRARFVMGDAFPSAYTSASSDGDLEFLKYTTLSFKQIEEGSLSLLVGDLTRNKAEHLEMFRERLRERPGTKTFLADAVEGVQSIMRQQLSQGAIGDMSRVAKTSLMCFVRGAEGGTYVVTRNSRVLVDPSSTPASGSPSVRCAMLLCSVAQQAALHAPRVGSKTSPSMNLISSVLRGREEAGADRPCRTLYILKGREPGWVRDRMGASWVYETDGLVLAVALDSAVDPEVAQCVEGAYSPVVLSACPAGRRRGVCSLALNVVFNLYGLAPEGDDARDLVAALCYEVGASPLPVTTREGMLARKLGWMETLMACDYTKVPLLKGSSSFAWTSTSAAMCSNFDLVP